MYYTEEQTQKLYDNYKDFLIRYDKIFEKFLTLKLEVLRANEFLQHGFLRRLKTIKNCIDDIFDIYPPERTELLTDDERHILEISAQAIVIHVFGCLDDLAWIYKEEKNIKINKLNVSLFKNKFQNQINNKIFIDFLNNEKIKSWFDNTCKDNRDAIAHRIPIYIPPVQILPENLKRYEAIEGILRTETDLNKRQKLYEEQDNLSIICPIYRHSIGENAPLLYLHQQLIDDVRTVFLIAEMFFDEFRLTH